MSLGDLDRRTGATEEWLRQQDHLFALGLQDEDVAPLARTVEAHVPLLATFPGAGDAPDPAFPAAPPGGTR